MRRARLPLGLLLVLGWRAVALAGEASVPARDLDGGSLTSALLRLSGGLIFVFALLFGGLWLARNSRRLVAPNARSPKLAILEVKSVGQRQALYVVAYERQRMLVASSPAGVTLLAQLPSAEAGEPVPSPAVPSFAEVLIQTVTRKP
jgi:flagellar biogenesis protein FliO